MPLELPDVFNHEIASAIHTASGLTIGHVLTATGAATFDFQAAGGGEINTDSTTDATPKDLATIAIPDNTVALIEVTIVARRTNGVDDASFVRRAEVRRESAGAATLRTPVNTPFSRKSDSTWEATIVVSGNNAIVQVTGATGKDIDWRSVHLVNQLS